MTGAAVVATRPKRPTGARRADVRSPAVSQNSPLRPLVALSPARDTEDEDLHHLSPLSNLGPLGRRLASVTTPHSPTTSDSNWSELQL